ncbi:glycoside hydrolase family 127 protein, partial [Enterobacter hormaechei]|nr:glycoside hydrolase family 127 protein [Enterobacter hormaechei]
SWPQVSAFRVFEGKGIFAHKLLIQAEGIGCQAKDTDAVWLYDHSPVERQPRTLTFIPWFSWANRGEGEMRIWVDES